MAVIVLVLMVFQRSFFGIPVEGLDWAAAFPLGLQELFY